MKLFKEISLLGLSLLYCSSTWAASEIRTCDIRVIFCSISSGDPVQYFFRKSASVPGKIEILSAAVDFKMALAKDKNSKVLISTSVGAEAKEFSFEEGEPVSFKIYNPAVVDFIMKERGLAHIEDWQNDFWNNWKAYSDVRNEVLSVETNCF